MRTALFAGTFDPPTLGHLDIITRSAPLFDRLYVGIAKNSLKKKAVFGLDVRADFLKKITASLPNVTIVSFDGLVVDFAKENNISALIRGIRPFHDLEAEYTMALANKEMTGIETLFLMASQDVAHISSSLIREIAAGKRRLHGFIPEQIEQDVFLDLTKLICD